MIVDEHFLAAYEEIDQLGKAFKIAESLLQFETRPAFAATFLRLCRKLEDYSPAAQLLQKHGELLNSDVFSLLYELVYYYEASSDLEKAKSLLSRLEELFEPSQPIQTTVRNFYLRLGLLNDAQRLDAKLASKLASKRARPGSRDEAERRQAIATKAKEVGAEVHDYLLHQQQLAAISELTRGISHELGQPITNVRYTVQFYMMEFDRELTKEKVKEVFDVILRQTERMGDLVKRLSPLTSSRHLLARFDACERIRNNLDAVATRLKNLQIKVFFPARVPIWLEGDTGHFDQITSNLIVNAIDALAGSPAESGRYIQVELREIGQSLQMTFEDNGPGFPVADRRRLFNPFYTTKPPGKGEGLGLFIVWNLLKMQGGTISLDSNYTGGARFRVTIRKNAVPMEKDEI